MSKKKLKEKVDWKIVCVGLCVLGIIEAMALLKGINGILLTTIVGIICTVIGVAIPGSKILKGGER